MPICRFNGPNNVHLQRVRCSPLSNKRDRSVISWPIVGVLNGYSWCRGQVDSPKVSTVIRVTAPCAGLPGGDGRAQRDAGLLLRRRTLRRPGRRGRARHARCVDEGADLVDIGGESHPARRGAGRRARPSCARVLPVIRELAAAGVPMSIDTTRAAVAAGRAGRRRRRGQRRLRRPGRPRHGPRGRRRRLPVGADALARALAANARAGHLRRRGERGPGRIAGAGRRGGRRRRGARPAHPRPRARLRQEGRAQLAALRAPAGARRARAIPVLFGASRKSYLGPAAGRPPDGDARPADRTREAATIATTVLAVAAGAWGVRVHEVRGQPSTRSRCGRPSRRHGSSEAVTMTADRITLTGLRVARPPRGVRLRARQRPGLRGRRGPGARPRARPRPVRRRHRHRALRRAGRAAGRGRRRRAGQPDRDPGRPARRRLPGRPAGTRRDGHRPQAAGADPARVRRRRRHLRRARP